jgi:hypothetical protein
MSAIPILRHFARTLAHKWFVLVAGLRIGVPLWRLVIHDWTKFTPIEARGYAYKFFGGRGAERDWHEAWQLHWTHNPHHWERWQGAVGEEPSEMPDVFVREMVADWLAASRAYGGAWPQNLAGWRWWQDNKERIVLHPKTKAKVIQYLILYFVHSGARRV